MPKILIVDDELLIIKSLEKLLSKAGHQVVSAQNAATAIKKVENTDFDLIISDIRMPGMTGISLVKKIRQLLQENNRRQIPEVMMTGYASDDAVKEVEDIKAVDYIYKPFDTRQFLESVKKALKK